MSMMIDNYTYFAPREQLRINRRPGMIARFLGALVEAFGDIKEARERRRTMNLLEALDDRTLKDIGIDRSEIASLALELSEDQAIRSRR